MALLVVLGADPQFQRPLQSAPLILGFAGPERHEPGLLQELHRLAQFLVRVNGVAVKVDFLDLDLGAFLDHKGEELGVGWDILRLVADLGVLAALFGQEIRQDHDGSLNLGRIEGSFNPDTHLLFLVFLQNFGLSGRFQTFIFDAPDHRAFLHPEDHNLAALAVLRLDPNIVKVPRLPNGSKVAPQQRRVQKVVGLGENVELDRFLGNSSGSSYFDVFNDVSLLSPSLALPYAQCPQERPARNEEFLTHCCLHHAAERESASLPEVPRNECRMRIGGNYLYSREVSMIVFFRSR